MHLSLFLKAASLKLFRGQQRNIAPKLLQRSHCLYNVFWSQQHIVQRKSFFVCMLVKFAGIVYIERLPATRNRFIPQSIKL